MTPLLRSVPQHVLPLLPPRLLLSHLPLRPLPPLLLHKPLLVPLLQPLLLQCLWQQSGLLHLQPPQRKNKGVVLIASDEDEETMEGPVFKRRKATTVATSHSFSARRPTSLRDNPPVPPLLRTSLHSRMESRVYLRQPLPLPLSFPWSFNKS